MYLRQDQYRPLYYDSEVPFGNCSNLTKFHEQLFLCLSDNEHRAACGERNREWLVKFHGHETTQPILRALLQFAGARAELPGDIYNPLASELTDEEIEFNLSTLRWC